MCVVASAIVDIVVVVLCWNMMALVAGGNGRIFKHESQFRTSTLQESVQPELAVPDAGRNAAALSLMASFFYSGLAHLLGSDKALTVT
jgi:hypothetical protein